jgi:glycosyltransferase involved in cell wall biosynthesis
MSPKVSIITGAYNAQDFISETIKSVLSQSFCDFEWIIIDDGSTDDTPAILAKAQEEDARIKLCSHENMGLTQTLNVGLEKATGEFIARIDCDDLWEYEKLEKQVEFLDSHPEVGLLACNYEQIDEDGNHLGKSHAPYLSDHDTICKSFIKFNPFVHSSVMFRRSILDKVGGYDPHFKYTQDYQYWVRMAQHTKLTSLKDVLVYHRVSKQAISFSKLREQRGFALSAKLLAFNVFKHPTWDLRFLVKDFLVTLLPQFVIRILKKA